jgi:hypothetical protein
MRIAYKIFVGRLQGNNLLGRPRRRLKDIEMDIKEVECECGLDLAGSGGLL